MSVLVVGGSGFLGAEVVRQAVATHELVTATFLRHPANVMGPTWHVLDVRDQQQTADLVATLRPEVVINTAYQQDDWVTTADGAAHVAIAAVSGGARLVQVSSDAVFPGAASR